MVAGAFFCALGLGVSLFTHLSAGQAGGIYLVWYGPVAGGAWLAVKGLLDLRGQGALPTAVSWRPKPVR